MSPDGQDRGHWARIRKGGLIVHCPCGYEETFRTTSAAWSAAEGHDEEVTDAEG
jgi:hypothetical protein